jgi:predicted glycosyltransferase
LHVTPNRWSQYSPALGSKRIQKRKYNLGVYLANIQIWFCYFWFSLDHTSKSQRCIADPAWVDFRTLCKSMNTALSHEPRILLYSHDTYGLGHLRRTLAIARRLAQDLPQAHLLLVTGSMVAGAFDLPPHLDLIKLPALSKHSNGRYKARVLPLSLPETIAWREQMILQAASLFQPDLVLVDKTPGGVQHELLPTLRYLKTWQPHTRLVLGMRDIEDDPETTCAEWESCGARQLHEEVYDHLLLYGEREVFDPVREYKMSPTAESKLVSCGYLGGATPTRSREDIRRELDVSNRPLIVVTVGGGGDGFDLLQTYLQALDLESPLRTVHTLVVTGPLMARGKREQLQGSCRARRLTLKEFTPDLVSYLAAADLVVSMAGYNTVFELLSLGVRTLLIPRIRPRREQQLRAERLAARGFARVLHPNQLSPQRLASEIANMLASPANLNGLAYASKAIISFLENAPSQREAVLWKTEAPLAITLPPRDRLSLPLRVSDRDG